jgi:hypothetical protein
MIKDSPCLYKIALIDINKIQLINVGEQQQMLRFLVEILKLLLTELMKLELFRVQRLRGLSLIDFLLLLSLVNDT